MVCATMLLVATAIAWAPDGPVPLFQCVSEIDGYAIGMPSSPERTIIPFPTADRGLVPTRAMVAGFGAESFLAAAVELPGSGLNPGLAVELLTGDLARPIESSGYQVVSYRRIIQTGLQGRQMQMVRGSQVLTMRLFLNGDRLHILMHIGVPGQVSAAFFDSFRAAPTAPPLPTESPQPSPLPGLMLPPGLDPGLARALSVPARPDFDFNGPVATSIINSLGRRP